MKESAFVFSFQLQSGGLRFFCLEACGAFIDLLPCDYATFSGGIECGRVGLLPLWLRAEQQKLYLRCNIANAFICSVLNQLQVCTFVSFNFPMLESITEF